MSVQGGNWRIFDGMLNASKADVRLGSKVGLAPADCGAGSARRASPARLRKETDRGGAEAARPASGEAGDEADSKEPGSLIATQCGRASSEGSTGLISELGMLETSRWCMTVPCERTKSSPLSRSVMSATCQKPTVAAGVTDGLLLSVCVSRSNGLCAPLMLPSGDLESLAVGEASACLASDLVELEAVISLSIAPDSLFPTRRLTAGTSLSSGVFESRPELVGEDVCSVGLVGCEMPAGSIPCRQSSQL